MPLTRERVLRAAVSLADGDGLDAVSMRKVGQELGVEAMSLYNHVDNKEDILEGMLEIVMLEIEEATDGFRLPREDDDWKSAMRERIMTARKSMLRHKWAPSILETRTEMSPLMVRYTDALIGIMRHGGLSYDLAHHAMHTLGTRMLGFNLELFEPESKEESEADTMAIMTQMAPQIPHLIEMMTEIVHDDGPDNTMGWCDDETEFVFSLDLVLDGLERVSNEA